MCGLIVLRRAALCVESSLWRLLRGILLLFFSLGTSLVEAQSAFPTGPLVEAQKRFWEKIFTVYPSYTAVIHDSHFPDNIIDVIDFKVWGQKKGMRELPSLSVQRQVVKSYLKRYRLGLKRFRRLGRKALKYGAMEKRIYSVYQDSPREKRLLLEGKIFIRSQGGLSDEFTEAIARSNQYIHFMEDVFRKSGLPEGLTRLVFVESMFQVKARSRVGASGVWQFMPGTARRFMKVNRYFDERNSPFKATRGAASLLKANYKALGSWPLAITAYNHGVTGMKRAMRHVGSGNFGRIVEQYQHKNFGFASRNFYAEFLAAKRTYERYIEKRPFLRNSAKKYISVVLNRPYSLFELLRDNHFSQEELLRYNRCLDRSLFSRFRHKRLPKNYELFFPVETLPKISSRILHGGLQKHAKPY